MKILKVFPALIMMLFAVVAKGQSVKEVEDTMLYYIVSVNRLDTTYGNDDKFDSLQLYDKHLLDYLTVELVKIPATLKYDFPELKHTGMEILTSDDKMFRIYYDPAMKVSDDKQNIYIPVVTEEGKVTAKHLVYVFDGNNYVFDKHIK